MNAAAFACADGTESGLSFGGRSVLARAPGATAAGVSRLILLLAAFLVPANDTVAQSSAVDLEAQLPTAVGNRRVNVLNELAALIVEREPQRALALTGEALELAQSLGNRAGEAAARFGNGDGHRVLGNHRAALEEYGAALRLHEKLDNQFEKGRSLRRLGDLHYFIADLERALRLYDEALKVFEALAESGRTPRARIQVAHLLTTIGNVLKDSNNLAEALDYYRRSQAVYRAEDYAIGIRGSVYNIGSILQQQGMVAEAEEQYRQALDMALAEDDRYLESLVLNSLGSLGMERGALEEAEALFLRALDISRDSGRKRGTLSNYKSLLELSRRRGNHVAALEYARQAEKLATELEDGRILADLVHEKSRVLEDMGNHVGALADVRRYLELRDELFSEMRLRQVDELRLRFETEAKEREIEALKKEKTLQKLLILVVAAGLMVAVAFLVLVGRAGRMRARSARAIAEKNAELSAAYSRMEELSRTDELTKISNRRAVMERLRHEQDRSGRSGRPYCIVLADVDDFKRWNDRFGHACGDALLVALAERLGGAVRAQDLIGRWGGEEFLVVLPDTRLEGAIRVAEKLRVLASAEPFMFEGNAIVLTLTAGVSEGGQVPVDETLRRADGALYTGKRRGKNRVETAPAK